MILYREGDFEITLARIERDLALLNQNFISQVQNIRLYIPHDALHILEKSPHLVEHLKQLGDRADRKGCCSITLEVSLIGYDPRLRITKRGLQALKGFKTVAVALPYRYSGIPLSQFFPLASILAFRVAVERELGESMFEMKSNRPCLVFYPLDN